MCIRDRALLREALFPTENMTVSGKPETMQFGDLLGGTTPEAIDRQNRFQNFADLTQQLKDAPESELAAKRHDVFDWLNRNKDLYDAATRMGEQSADSRVVSTLDSYFGTNNLDQFIQAKQKYDQVAEAITPEPVSYTHLRREPLTTGMADPAGRSFSAISLYRCEWFQEKTLNLRTRPGLAKLRR